MSDVIITGLPRSGLTVAAALADSLPNSVCLNAPPWHVLQARKTGNSLLLSKWIAGDFLWQRAQLQKQVPVRDFRAEDGPLLDGLLDPRRITDKSGKEKPVLFARRGLRPGFTLGMKHHALYSALLPELIEFSHFTIIAVIRHPLDVITSWKQCAGMPYAQGKLPMAARFWPEIERIGNSKVPPLERMVQLYDAHIERYYRLRDRMTIVKFEDILENPMLLSTALGKKTLPAATRRIERKQRAFMADEAEELRDHLRKYSVFTKHFYAL